MGEGEGEVRKGENIRVRETALNEKNSCTPRDANKYSCTSLKKSYIESAHEKKFMRVFCNYGLSLIGLFRFCIFVLL